MSDTHKTKAGLLEVRASGAVAERGGAIVIDFASGESEVLLDLNGAELRASDPAGLATALRAHRDAAAGRLMSIPFTVDVEGTRIVIDPAPIVLGSDTGASLTGSEAQAAVDKASRIVQSDSDAWPEALPPHAVETADLDSLAAGPRWDGPLVVSMPRTGSTLMGVLFLFCREAGASARYRFDRYLHEPVAPVFWRGDDLRCLSGFLEPPLSDRDVVQESAYQFADPRVAHWFLAQARPPVVFTMRHPQLSWPSRWRAMLAQLVEMNPDHSNAPGAQRALAEDDFSGLGGFLTESVRPADNGFYAFMSLLALCVREAIEFVIVDNTRFRTHPESTVQELCRRLDIPEDDAMTSWGNLDEVRSRVVMGDLALGEEYPWYYAQTLGSTRGIEPETRPLLAAARFPEQLRGLSDEHLTIDEAVTWYQLLLARPETLT